MSIGLLDLSVNNCVLFVCLAVMGDTTKEEIAAGLHKSRMMALEKLQNHIRPGGLLNSVTGNVIS